MEDRGESKTKMKILVVRKLSALEFYYHNNHGSEKLKESKAEQDECTRHIVDILEREKQNYEVVTRLDLRAGHKIDRYDFLFSAGGDGTAIAAAAYNKDTPQLNLRTDQKSNGVLCQKDSGKAVSSVLNNDYSIEEWTRQDVFLNGNFTGRALNETAVGEQLKFTKVARYEITFQDNHRMYTGRHLNSGLVVVTGTGSTGWPGLFKPYSRASKLFKFNVIAPYSGEINEGESNYFKIKYLGHEGGLAIDTAEHDFARDDALEIKVSKNPLKVVIPNKCE